MKQNMFRGNTQSNIVNMVVILALLLFNIRPLEAARHLDVKMSKLGTGRCRFHIIEHYHLLLLIHALTYRVGFVSICRAAVDAAPHVSTNIFFFFFFQCSPIRSEMV